MCFIKPFKGLRPNKEKASKIAIPGTDHLSEEIIKKYKIKNPWSFLNIFHPECTSEEEIDAEVKKKFNLMKANSIISQDATDCFYVYKISTKDHSQLGIIAKGKTKEYTKSILGHEKIYAENSNRRFKQIKNLQAQIGPIYVIYPDEDKIAEILRKHSKTKPDYLFDSFDNCQHELWAISNKNDVMEIESAFSSIKKSYLADGHHRMSALYEFQEYNEKNNVNHNGTESYNFFMMSLFSDKEAKILDYNRLIKDLNNLSEKEFFALVDKHFIITKQSQPYSPQNLKSFGMYLNNAWFSLDLKNKPQAEIDKLIDLDINILHEYLLGPALNIGDPRVDKRIDFIAGFHGLKAIEKKVDSGLAKIGFSFFPTPIEHVIKFAENNLTMPPKSTWFDPKPLDGLITYEF